MKLRVFSDLHLDFDAHLKKPLWTPTALPDDSSTTLVLAGDLWTANKAFVGKWIDDICARFYNVFVVLGNHDYWDMQMDDAVDKAKKSVKHINNCYVMENSCVIVDNVKIIGSTLWTDFWNNPIAEERARSNMNDYNYTKINDNGNYRKLRPSDTAKVHAKSRDYIFKHAVRDNPEQKIVVITHMAPSKQSLSNDSYHNRMLDSAYCSNLDNAIIENNNIDLWIHGHIHETKDYMIGNTRIYANPRGYESHEDTGYSKDSVLVV